LSITAAGGTNLANAGMSSNKCGLRFSRVVSRHRPIGLELMGRPFDEATI
jgi:hypothetical protein